MGNSPSTPHKPSLLTKAQTIGTIQTSAKLNFCLWGPLVTKMSLFQRLSGVVYTISSLFTVFLTASLLTMPIVLISGGTLVAYATFDELRWLVRLCFFALMANRLNEWAMYLPAGYRLGQRDSGAMMWMAPCKSTLSALTSTTSHLSFLPCPLMAIDSKTDHAMTIIRSFLLPTWLGGKVAAFTATGGLKSELNERDIHLRAPLLRRLKVIMWDCKLVMHLFYLLFCIAAVVKSTVVGIIINKGSTEQTALYMLTHACWPPILWLIAFNACWAPIHYAIWPPTVPDREDLLDRDPLTGIAHPTEAAKSIRWDKSNGKPHSLL